MKFKIKGETYAPTGEMELRDLLASLHWNEDYAYYAPINKVISRLKSLEVSDQLFKE